LSNKVYDSGKTLNDKILKGVNTLADNVSATLGPKGRTVLLQKKGGNPVITKDGVTVAKFVDLCDPFENIGAQIIKQAASVTNTAAGDGTTTATVLAQAVLNNSQKYLAAGANPTEMKRGMDKAVTAICESLDGLARGISSEADIVHIATISANNDKAVGALVSAAVTAAGKNGGITIEEAKSVETTLDLIEGFQFKGGYCAGAFVTDQRRAVMKYEEPFLLVCDGTIKKVEELLPVLEQVAREGRPLIVVAEDVQEQALAALIMNTVRGSMKVAAVKVGHYGETRKNTLRDLAVSSGATLVSRETGLALPDVKLTHLGMAKTVESSKSWTTVVGAAGDRTEVSKHIEFLNAELEATEEIHEAEKTQERITRLASGVAVIKVGGTTEVEMVEKKHRIEDALAAIKAAREEGILSGGGTSLVRAANLMGDLDTTGDERLGLEVIKVAAKEPIRQMAKNAGLSPDLIVAQVLDLEDGQGYNFATDEIVDMYAAGILDPTKVTKSALRNAVSAAGTLITTNHAIIECE